MGVSYTMDFGPYSGAHRVVLVQLAEQLAGKPGEMDAARFLRRFRAVYQHLAATVESSGANLAASAPFGAPDPFARNPEELRQRAREWLEQTDGQLDEALGDGAA